MSFPNPKTDLDRKLFLWYRMKHPMAYVHNENNGEQTLIRTIHGQGARLSETNSEATATAIIACAQPTYVWNM